MDEHENTIEMIGLYAKGFHKKLLKEKNINRSLKRNFRQMEKISRKLDRLKAKMDKNLEGLAGQFDKEMAKLTTKQEGLARELEVSGSRIQSSRERLDEIVSFLRIASGNIDDKDIQRARAKAEKKKAKAKKKEAAKATKKSPPPMKSAQPDSTIIDTGTLPEGAPA